MAGGCGGAARGRVGDLGAGGEERQHGRVQASAVASAEVGGRVGAGAGRLRRAAALTAHGRHAVDELCRGRARRGASAGRRARRQARRGAGLGWAKARRAARREAGWASFGRGPEARRRPAKEKKPFFICIFKEFLNANFQTLF